MTKRQRTLLFFSLGLLFLVTAPAVALYAQGYRIDLENRRVTQTGAFYVKAQPGRVTVSIDGKAVKTTEFFFDSALTKNFLPGPHRVAISKEGFVPWEKTLELRARQVAEVKNVVLFPKELEFQALSGGAQDLWMAPDRTRAVLLRKGLNGMEALYVNLQTRREEVLWRQLLPAEEVLTAHWDEASKRVLLTFSSGERLRRIVKYPEQSACPERTCSLDFLGSSLAEADFSPAEDRVILQRRLGSRSFLQEADYREQKELSFWGNQVVSFQVAGSSLFWLDEGGFAWQLSLAAPGEPQLLNRTPLPVRQETFSALVPLGNAVFVHMGDILYLRAPGQQEFRAIAENVSGAAVSPDRAKIALAGPAELSVYYLADQREQPEHRAGEQVFLTRFGTPLSEPLWLTSHYLAFAVEGTVKATEIDDRDGLNMMDLGAFSNPDLFWEPKDSVLYVFDGSTLFASEKVIK